MDTRKPSLDGARAPSPSTTLVIGYGNDLRGDDGAGVHAASLLAGRATGLQSIVTRQLTPDLAADIAQVGRVVFVDAYPADRSSAPLRVEKLQCDSEARASPFGHRAEPASLVSLARQLFGKAPDAWVVGIPAFCFEPGEPISARTAQWVDEAVALIEGGVFFDQERDNEQ